MWIDGSCGAPVVSRRGALKTLACGFGYLAFAGIAGAAGNPLAARPPSAVLLRRTGISHFRPCAKRIIFLFMQGGPSQVDTFDYKPRLEKEDGKKMPFDDARTIANTGNKGTDQRVMKSPWKFAQHGQTGRWGSELFPQMARQVDDLCFVHSMQTEGVAHGPATLFLHCGATQFVRPSMGAWVTYGLGTENENLPGFVTIAPSLGNGGTRNFGNAFLPALYQGTAIGTAGVNAKELRLRNISTANESEARRRLDFGAGAQCRAGEENAR